MLLRRSLPGALLVVALTVGATPAALASNVGPGPGFGAHVSEHAPEHPIKHGRMFGQCVSGMATGECPHHGHQPDSFATLVTIVNAVTRDYGPAGVLPYILAGINAETWEGPVVNAGTLTDSQPLNSSEG